MRKLIDKLMDWLVPEREQLRFERARLEVTANQLVRAVNCMNPRQRKKYFLNLHAAGLATIDHCGLDVPFLDLRIK